MKAILFGASGQVGKEVVERANLQQFQLYCPSRQVVSIIDKDSTLSYISAIQPDYIINCAAFTAVDIAETEVELCEAVNAKAPEYMALAAKENNSFLIHISTDYVFSGKHSDKKPLTETDLVDPVNVYGKTKLAGEHAVQGVLEKDKVAILGTASVHGKYGQNFVHTMLKLFAEKESVSVVADQYMSPTWAGFLAESILTVIQKKIGGLYHVSSKNGASWFEFAEIIEQSTRARRNGKVCSIEKTTAEKFKRPAPRPEYSVFLTDRFEKTFGIKVPTWQEGLEGHLKGLV